MKVIVGLGNPGKQYEHTRHNVGFMVIDKLSENLGIPLDKQKFNGLYGMGFVGTEKVLLCKPLTYMNLSGECVRPLIDFYDLTVEDLVVIYDDLDLPVGKIRLRTKGSPGGHNGIKSLVHHFNTQNFKRIRIGIDRPQPGMKVPDYVLGRFTDDEKDSIQDAINLSAEASEAWVTHPFIEVMNKFN